jgi:hypothetical protein
MATTKIEFNLFVPSSATWPSDFDATAGDVGCKFWTSPKLSHPSGHKFQLKFFVTTLSAGGAEFTKVVVRNCRMRKVKLDSFGLIVGRTEGVEEMTSVSSNVNLKRSGAPGSGYGVFFDRNLFAAAVSVTVVIEIDDAIRRGLKDDLRRQLLDELSSPFFSDATLKVGDGELKCHGFMLSARSEVFKAMLMQPGFVEGRSRRIEIDDLSVGTAKELLKFVYTDSFDADEDNIYDLFVAADKYDIPLLKKECSALLAEGLDVSSAAECFALAYLCRCERLLQKSAKIIAHNLAQVEETEGWKGLSSQQREKAMEEVRRVEEMETLIDSLKIVKKNV